MDTKTPNIDKCGNCKKPATKVCTSCTATDPKTGKPAAVIKYCSKECQKKHWPLHKGFCKVLREVQKFQAQKIHTYRKVTTSDLEAPAIGAHDVETDEPHSSDALLLYPVQIRQPTPAGIREERYTGTWDPAYLESDQFTADKIEAAVSAGETGTVPHDSFHPCAVCGKPALMVCLGCSGAPSTTHGLTATTWYCHPEHGIEHRSEHEETCLASQTRRVLYNAGATLREEYYTYCHSVLTVMVKKGTLNNRHMFLHDEDSVLTSTSGFALLRTMSRDSEEEKTFLACLIGNDKTEGIADGMGMHFFSLLHKLYKTISMATVTFKTLRRRYTRQGSQAAPDKHHLMHMTLKNGEEYALDMSGMQFGITDPVVPWAFYLEEYVGQVESEVLLKENK